MTVFCNLMEVDQQGFEKGPILINLDAVIYIKEVALGHRPDKFCCIVTRALSADMVMAAELQATASYSTEINVRISMERMCALMTAQPPT